jgi:hypothetical protein
MKTSTGIAGFLALTFAVGAVRVNHGWAQTNEDHGAHHPGDAPSQAMPNKPAGGMAGSKGGMPGMMGGDMQPMMRMMQMMQERMAQQDTGGMMGSEHMEGRIAFLRAELGITDAQQPQWTAFAAALRAQAGTMKTMRGQMMQGGMPASWPDRLALEERTLSSRLDAVKAMEAPGRALYTALSAEQQKKADELMGHGMGGM